MMSKTHLPHIPEDTLELYSMGRLSESEIEVVEEHLLVCNACQDSLQETEDFVRAFRAAVPELEIEPELQSEAGWRDRWQNWWGKLFAIPAPMIAAAACAVLAFVILVPRHTPTAVVDLQAMRGAEAASIAPPDASLTLNLSLRGLENPGPLRMEIADEVGNIVRRADTTRSGERATAKTDGLKAGAYWVRLYSGSELLREYGLTVR